MEQVANSIHFIKAETKDADIVADISRRTFYDTFYETNSLEDMELFLNASFNLQAIEQELKAPENIILLAYQQEELCGYAKLSESVPPVELFGTDALEIARLYIDKEKIGLGVGAALMQKSIEIAREKNKQAVWLGVWEHNQRAIDFYQKWGFKKFAQHYFTLGTDLQNDWLMKKML